MSVQALAWVYERSGLPLTERAILAVYAYHADEHGENAWPSLTTVASESGADRRTVARVKARLEANGQLERTGTRGTGTLVYRLSMGSTRGTAPLLGAQRPQVGKQVGAESHSARGTAPPEPSLTVHEQQQGVEPAIQHPTLNGSVPEILARFRSIAASRPPKTPLKVEAARIVQTLLDYAEIPDLRLQALNCAEWLGSDRALKLRRKDANRTLRGWLDKQREKVAAAGPRDDDW